MNIEWKALLKINLSIAQTPISKNIQENVRIVLDYIDKAESDLLVFPEGMISGYYPEESDFLSSMDPQEINSGLEEIIIKVKEKKQSIIIGTAIQENGIWYNVALFITGKGERSIYRKCNLSNLDRNHFQFGNSLDTYKFNGEKIGIQICREIKFSDQFLYLKIKGAKIVFHLNNNQSGFANWLMVYRVRAYENQIFVISVNVSHKGQKLFSYVINPEGFVQLETTTSGLYSTEIETNTVSNNLLEQRRNDLIDIVHKHH